jgi:hypothetical protein
LIRHASLSLWPSAAASLSTSPASRNNSHPTVARSGELLRRSDIHRDFPSPTVRYTGLCRPNLPGLEETGNCPSSRDGTRRVLWIATRINGPGCGPARDRKGSRVHDASRLASQNSSQAQCPERLGMASRPNSEETMIVEHLERISRQMLHDHQPRVVLAGPSVSRTSPPGRPATSRGRTSGGLARERRMHRGGDESPPHSPYCS